MVNGVACETRASGGQLDLKMIDLDHRQHLNGKATWKDKSRLFKRFERFGH